MDLVEIGHIDSSRLAEAGLLIQREFEREGITVYIEGSVAYGISVSRNDIARAKALLSRIKLESGLAIVIESVPTNPPGSSRTP